jgi:drug/metabolite transporter (DMT)-like permease
MLVVLLGFAAAALLAVGFVLQQHEAARSTAPSLGPRLLVTLVRRPVWLGGIGATTIGLLASSAALGLGSLVVVEPLLATNVLFALPLAAWWSRHRLGGRELAGCVCLVGGLAVLLIAGSPDDAPGDAPVAPVSWVVALAGLVCLVVVLISVARHREPSQQATVLATAAGLAFGMQDVLTQRTIELAESSITGMLTSWQPYALVVIGFTGLTLEQSAFGIAPLAASLPAMTLAEPLCGIGLGIGLLGEGLRTTSFALPAQIVGLAATLSGVWLVSRSPIVTGSFGPAPPELEPEVPLPTARP